MADQPGARPPWRTAPVIIVPLLLLDQISKRLVVARLAPGEPHAVLGEVVRFRLTYNLGAAYGIDVGPYGRWIMGGIALVVLGALIYLLARTSAAERGRAWGLTLVIAGALGNLIDRVISSRGVVDFIDVGLGTTRFYTFNVADSCVTIGAVLLIFFSGSHGKPARPS